MGAVSARMVLLTPPLHPAYRKAPGLLPEAKFADDVAVSLDVCPVQIGQMPASLPHQLEQSTLRVVVMFVLPHVYGELVDALRQDRNLHFRRASITRRAGVLFDNALFDFLRYHMVLARRDPLNVPRLT